MDKFKVKFTNDKNLFEISTQPDITKLGNKSIEELTTDELLGVIRLRLKRQVELGNLNPEDFYNHLSNSIEP